MTLASAQKCRNVITLKGSTAIVTEFFEYAVSSILFQRGIYPAEYFMEARRYDLKIMIAEHKDLHAYLKTITEQMKYWVERGQLQRLCLVIISGNTEEVLEQWTFKVDSDRAVVEGTEPCPEKSDKAISKEIAAIIRQITASNAFLPMLGDACMFDLLLYTDKDVHVPDTWEDREEPPIHNPQEVPLRRFSTKVHGVHGSVVYRSNDSDDEADSQGNPTDSGAMVHEDVDTDGISDAQTV